jgi:hypothetical protein
MKQKSSMSLRAAFGAISQMGANDDDDAGNYCNNYSFS